MTDTLETAVDNVIDRLLLLEPLAYSPATYATMRWIEIRGDTPYWVNRIASLTVSGSESVPEYLLVVQMRLILSYQQAVMVENDIDGNPQVKAWAAVPRVIRYFEDNRALDKAGSTALTHIDAARVTIACPRGLDLQVLPLSREILLSVDFELTVPLFVGELET